MRRNTPDFVGFALPCYAHCLRLAFASGTPRRLKSIVAVDPEKQAKIEY